MNLPSSPVIVSNAVNTSLTGLPLRHDDPVSSGLLLKVLLITTLLLTATYVVLRWYTRRNNSEGALLRPGEVTLRCIAAVRLSTRTKVYLLKAGESEVIITETPSGAQVTILFEKQDNNDGSRLENQEKMRK